MSNLKVRKSPLPSLWALIVLALCVAASMFITYRASAQSEKGAAPSVRPAPSKAEDSATIQDDPTIAAGRQGIRRQQRHLPRRYLKPDRTA